MMNEKDINIIISLIVPVYNAEKTVEKCLGSIIKQSNPNWEIVVVNDGSTDSSLDILNRLAKGNSKIKIINQENSGPGIARNIGVQYATGEYIAYLDSDDYLDKDYIEIVLKEILSSNPDVVFIDAKTEKEDGTFIKSLRRSTFANLSKEKLLR